MLGGPGRSSISSKALQFFKEFTQEHLHTGAYVAHVSTQTTPMVATTRRKSVLSTSRPHEDSMIKHHGTWGKGVLHGLPIHKKHLQTTPRRKSCPDSNTRLFEKAWQENKPCILLLLRTL